MQKRAKVINSMIVVLSKGVISELVIY